MAKRKRKASHGGARPGAGRKATLEKPVKVLVTLEREQARKLDGLCKRTARGRSAALRDLIDSNIKEESDNGRPQTDVPVCSPDPAPVDLRGAGAGAPSGGGSPAA